MRGYDRDQVTDHIRQLEADLAMMAADRDSAHAHSDELLNHLDQTRARVRSLQEDVDALSVPPTTVTGMSDRLSRMLTLATEEAGEIRSTARDEAAEMISVARQDADAARSDAQTEAARTLELAQQQADKLITEAEERAAAIEQAAAEERERARAIVAAAENDASGLRGAAHHVAAARLARSRELAQAAHEAHKQIVDHLGALREHITALPGALELSDDELDLVGTTETDDLELLNRTLVGRDRFEEETSRVMETTDVLDAVDDEYADGPDTGPDTDGPERATA